MLNSRSSKNAMTLAEVLMCVGVLGLIVAFTLPMLHRLIPSKEESFHKKMNYVVEQVVTQLYDDEAMYPRKSDFYAQGFQNLEKVTINSIEYGGDIKGNAAEQKKAKEKFCRLFASKFEMSSESGKLVCENETDDKKVDDTVTLALGKRSFRSKDNVDWYLPVTDFKNGAAQIMIDVNNTEGPNCLEGSAGCTKPDRFLYYVKPNGAITFEQPTDVTKNSFGIDVNVKTEGCSTTTCHTTKGGEYEIATLSESGSVGTFHAGNSFKSNLQSNTRYVIKAKPYDGYYVSWSMDPNIKAPVKKVKVYNSDVHVDLTFHKKSAYCIIVNYENCAEDDVTNCATAELTSGCGYTSKGNKNGHYKLNSDGAYEYVGLGVDGGEYDYQCGGIKDAYGNVISSSTDNLQFGRPVINQTTGAITADKSYQSAYKCNNHIGDYKLVVTPQDGYKVLPITTEHPNGKYEQDVRLGPENIEFTVTLSR